ncbi:MAG: DUF3849 domain-containing protein [Clostridia bacterium]|nr:DUF3849 domain-containing protein [Clostridia bacterium]
MAERNYSTQDNYTPEPVRQREKTMAEYAEDAMKGIYPPIYYGTRADAQAKDEDAAIRVSRTMDSECLSDVRHFLFARSVNPIRQEETERMIRKWGVARLSYNLACTVRYAYPAKYYTEDNLKWAYSVPLTSEAAYNRSCLIDAMPENLDRFISQLREHIRLNTPQEAQEEAEAEPVQEPLPEPADSSQEPSIDTPEDIPFNPFPSGNTPQTPTQSRPAANSAVPEATVSAAAEGTDIKYQEAPKYMNTSENTIQTQPQEPVEIQQATQEAPQNTEPLVQSQAPAQETTATEADSTQDSTAETVTPMRRKSKARDSNAPKRGPGRPRIHPLPDPNAPKRKRGRTPKERPLPDVAKEKGELIQGTAVQAEEPADNHNTPAAEADNIQPRTEAEAVQENTNTEIKETEEGMARKTATAFADEESAAVRTDERSMEDISRQAEELQRQWEQEAAEGFAETAQEPVEAEPQPMAGGDGNIPRDPKITMQNAENDGLHSTNTPENGNSLPPESAQAVPEERPKRKRRTKAAAVKATPDNPVEEPTKLDPGTVYSSGAAETAAGSAEAVTAETDPVLPAAEETANEPVMGETDPILPAAEETAKEPVMQETAKEGVMEETAKEGVMEESNAALAEETANASVGENTAKAPAEDGRMEETAEENPFVTDAAAPPAAPAPAPVEPGHEKPKPAPAPAPAPEQRPRTIWYHALVSQDAMIRMYEKSAFMRMPLNGTYAGYTYNYANRFIDPNVVKMSRAPAKGTEDAITLSFPESFKFSLTSREEGKEPVTLTAQEFYEAVNGTMKDSYATPRLKNGERGWLTLRVPADAHFITEDEEQSDTYTFMLPDRGKGDKYIVPKFLVSKQPDGDYIIHLPDDREVRLWNKSKSAGRITPQNLKDVIESASPEDYHPGGASEQRPESPEEKHVFVPATARICDTAASRLFRCPDGKFEKFSYYYPITLIKEVEGGYDLRVPGTMPVRIFKDEISEAMPPDQFVSLFDGTSSYTNDLQRPSLVFHGRIKSHERQLRENIPEEMKARPNWVAVHIRTNTNTGHLDKYLMSPVTGKFAESDNPKTWADFDTAIEYAKVKGYETIAYALDGKDGICCIDVDHCLDENGKFTPAAQRARSVVPAGCYAETSVSGGGIHFFGKMEPENVRSFSKDGLMEFYRKSHFISMTGACREGETKLESFDTPDMRNFIRNNFDKRKEYKKSTHGEYGLSSMSDREILEKAFLAKGGEVTMQLYQGTDLRHNHSNSDMALMNRLAFWCNGDREQMLRIFASSGLYRPEKSPDYYEGTAIKAILEIRDRYNPEAFRKKAEEERKARDKEAGRPYYGPKSGASGVSSATSSGSSSNDSQAQQDKIIPGKPIYGRYGNIKGYTQNPSGPEQGQ